MKRALLIGGMLVVAGCAQRGTPLAVTDRIDERGGTVVAADGRLSLTFSEGAVRAPVQITVEARPAAGFPRVVSEIYELGPDGLAFERPVILRVTGLSSTEELTLAQIVGSSAIPVESARWYPASGEVVAELEHFSSYAVMVVYTPCGGLACGDTCTVCDPLDPTCVEPPPAAKRCNQSGLCVQASLPLCPDAGVPAVDAGAGADTGSTPDAGAADTGARPDSGLHPDAGPGLCSDVDFQRPQPLVDVLLVIDTSGSMGEEQASLASDFPLLLQTLTQNNTDFHIGVITTDIDGNPGAGLAGGGALVSVPPVLTATTPNLAAAFANSVMLPLSGGASIDESGLWAAQLSLTATIGFHRPHSALTVIFMSDEDDQSPDPVDTYVNALVQAKGPYGQRRLQLNHITGPDGLSCSGLTGAASSGARYHAAGRRTGGAYSEICTTPYGQALTDLGPADYGYEFLFGLSQTITSTASLTVTVDGAAASSWTFDASRNAVVFPPTDVPPPSARVEIRYPCP